MYLICFLIIVPVGHRNTRHFVLFGLVVFTRKIVSATFTVLPVFFSKGNIQQVIRDFYFKKLKFPYHHCKVHTVNKLANILLQVHIRTEQH